MNDLKKHMFLWCLFPRPRLSNPSKSSFTAGESSHSELSKGCCPGWGAERETCNSSGPRASWTSSVETPLSVTQGEGLSGGHCCSPLGHLIFISLISQFVNDIFKSSVGSKIVSTISFFFFCMRGLNLLFFETEWLLSYNLKCVTFQCESLGPQSVSWLFGPLWMVPSCFDGGPTRRSCIHIILHRSSAWQVEGGGISRLVLLKILLGW